MTLEEAYVMNMNQLPLYLLETFSGEWLRAKDSHPMKRISLLGLINAKLTRYEKEYCHRGK